MTALHEDLLFKIFLEDTYAGPHFPFTKDRPLTTARHCSQVCRQWRSIFLLIDLNGLKETTDQWRNEIFARTGDAVLWVYGFVNRDKNWRRVQILVIRDINTLDMTSLDLQQEMIQVKQDNPLTSGLPTSPLFGDDAPLLKDFSMKHKFPTNVSWICNLSSISFPSTFNMDEVLTTLWRMPRLEYLSLMLKLDHANIHNTCFLLECITPPGQENGENKRYENAIKSYIIPYFCLHPPSAVRFSVDLDFLVLEDPIPLILRNPWIRCFRTELINAPWLPSINKLELYAMNFSKYHSAQNNAIIDSALYAFSSSATTLHTNDDTLRRLLEWAVSYTPTLVNCPWRYPPVEEEPPHHEFLKLRKAIGRPVSVDPGDLGYLEEHTRAGHKRELRFSGRC
ncbi:hypothetical protein CPC08DRAFT_711963 [Agrocybe pediades]|nr:hypothetical protein CPC08DRAFT_711963 [Agrocybe pediades]